MLIVTARLILRDFVDADALAFVAYQSDPRYLALYGPRGVDPDPARRLLMAFNRWRLEVPRRNYQLGVFQRDEVGALVGCGGLRTADTAEGTAELGIELAPDSWGRYAYATEIIDALLAFGFHRLKLREIRGVTSTGNKRAARLARWFGADEGAAGRETALTPASHPVKTEWRITRRAWMQSPAARRRSTAAVDLDTGSAAKA